MNFIDLIFHNLSSANPSKVVLLEVHKTKMVPFTAKTMLEMVHQARETLKVRGVKKGDRVGILGANGAKWTAIDLACLSLGAISVPLYHRQEPKELAAILNDCGPKLLVSEEAFNWNSNFKNITFSEIFSTDLPNGLFQPAEILETDIVTIVYTSGTSGEPKGVLLNRRNFDYMLDQTTSYLLDATERKKIHIDRVFHFLPLCFLGSRLMFWTQLYRGNSVMLSTDIKNLAEELETARPNYFLTVPTLLDRIRSGVTEKVREKGGLVWKAFQNGGLLAKLLIYPKIRKKIGPNLRFIISGSAPLSTETQAWFIKIGFPLLQVYGLTETTGIITMDRKKTALPGYVGSPIEGCEARVTAEGELFVRGPNVFPGYYKKPEATSQILNDGWLYTGDQVEQDADGRIRVLGRLKNILVPASGHNIAPEPIEQQLIESVRGVEHAFLVGHGKPFLSILITGETDENELSNAIEKLNGTLPHYRKIRTFKRIPDNFTVENGLLTANQKMRRREIELHLKPIIDEIYKEASA